MGAGIVVHCIARALPGHEGVCQVHTRPGIWGFVGAIPARCRVQASCYCAAGEQDLGICVYPYLKRVASCEHFAAAALWNNDLPGLFQGAQSRGTAGARFLWGASSLEPPVSPAKTQEQAIQRRVT